MMQGFGNNMMKGAAKLFIACMVGALTASAVVAYLVIRTLTTTV